MFRCEKCQRTFDSCLHRYVLSLHVADMTGQTWVNAFNEAGEALLGQPASDMVALRDADRAAFDRAIKNATFTSWRLKLRAKQETYQGELKPRLSVISMVPIPSAQETGLLLDSVAKIA